MTTTPLTAGFTPHERTTVGSLYWEAFATKMRPAFPSPDTGQAIITAALRPERILVAHGPDGPLGMCGFHLDGTGALDLGWHRLRAELSPARALRALAVLSLLERSESTTTLTLDGLCVSAEARGRGIGQSLLAAAERTARQHNKRSVRLTVIDANPRAAALYQRLGFRPISQGSVGILGLIYGFTGYTTMEKRLQR
ncbi:MAG: GNAT family N-acetyltransferase [Mycetocola sp.]